MDKDKRVGIQKLVYSKDSDIKDDEYYSDEIKKYKFVISAADFGLPDAPKTALKITSSPQMTNVLYAQTLEHQVFLKAISQNDSSITDDYSCLFLQERLKVF